MADLSVNFVGLELKNPIIASSATPTYCAKFIKKAEDGGAGAVVTKTVRFRTEFITRPRFMLVNKGADYDYSLTEKGAYFTLFRASDPYPIADKFVDELKKAKKMVNIPIIVSIGGDTAEEYEKLAIMMQEAGADALELNFHFPRNKTIQVYVDMLKAVKKVAKVPVIAKLMYAWHDPVEAAKQMEVAGADAITALGSVSLSALEIDVDNARPYLQPTHYGPGGSWFRPISLSYVAKVAKAVKLPISGVTGVVDWKDAAKYIMVGATTVQICGAIYAKGYKVLGEVANGLKAFMQSKGYKNINDFKGIALQRILPSTELEREPPIKSIVQEELCTGCKLCTDKCFWDAISFKEGKATIDVEKCEGCGICVCICPAKAIYMKRLK